MRADRTSLPDPSHDPHEDSRPDAPGAPRGDRVSIVIGFRRIWPPNHPNLALMLVLSIPAASGALSVVTMRPGPRRDWVVTLWFAVGLIGMALFLAVPVILAPRFVRPALGWREYNVLGCAVFYDLILWCGLAFVMRRNLVLRPCPHCRGKGLVSRRVQPGNGSSRQAGPCLLLDLQTSLARCSIGTQPITSIRDLGSLAGAREEEPACPACGEETLRRIPMSSSGACGVVRVIRG